MRKEVQQREIPSGHWVTATYALLLMAAWLAMHRYGGIWHDATIYAAQALYRIDPLAFRGDIFFAYGSQDQYTIFTSLYARAIRAFDLPLAATLLLAGGQIAWVGALAAMLRPVFQGRAFWMLLLLVAVLPPGYGSSGIFSYAETFLTARLWAEAVALLAVALALRGMSWLALTAIVLAASLHPPMALPAAVFVALVGFKGVSRLLLIAATLLGVAALALAGIGPFAQLFVPMDPEWRQIAGDRSPFAFVAQWRANEFGEPAMIGLLLATATAHAAGLARRLWLGGLAVFACGAALSLLTVFWPGGLLLQLQPWRALWLAKLLAIAAAVWLVRELWPRSPFNRLLLAGMAASLLTAHSYGSFAGLAVALLFGVHNRLGIDPPLHRFVPFAVWGVFAAVLAESIGSSIFVGTAAVVVPSRASQAFGFFALLTETGWFAFPALGVAMTWIMHRLPASRPAMLGAALLFTAYCTLHWSDPAARERAAFRHWQELAPLIETAIAPGELLYWEGNITMPWLALRRGNYVSPMQGAGIIFSATTAHEFLRRAERVSHFNPVDGVAWRRAGSPIPALATPPPGDGLIHLCHDPILAHVVIARDIGVTPSHRIPAGSYGGPFYIYDCRSLRRFSDPDST